MLCCLGTFKCNLRRNQLQCAQSKPRGPTQCDTWYEYEWRPQQRQQQHQHLISKYIKMRQWQPKTRPIRACIERQQQQQQQQMQLTTSAGRSPLAWPVRILSTWTELVSSVAVFHGLSLIHLARLAIEGKGCLANFTKKLFCGFGQMRNHL